MNATTYRHPTKPGFLSSPEERNRINTLRKERIFDGRSLEKAANEQISHNSHQAAMKARLGTPDYTHMMEERAKYLQSISKINAILQESQNDG